MLDFIAMAETLEAQAASLRRAAAQLAQEGQAELELEVPGEPEWHKWEGGDGPPADATGRNVHVRTVGGEEFHGPADAWVWSAGLGESQIAEWRLSADQPAD